MIVWPPPQSPDLNVSESVWEYSKKQKDLRQPTSTEDLQDVWNNLTADFLQKLCAIVPKRTDAVLRGKSGHTKYSFDLEFCSFSLHFDN